MIKIKLFGEWRNRELYGSDYKDAFLRAGKLQQCDKRGVVVDYGNRQVYESDPGEWRVVRSVIGLVSPPSDRHVSRGNYSTDNGSLKSALIEFEGGNIESVDFSEQMVSVA